MLNIGLVLEGGGMRGVFTAGVIDFFLEKDIDFKYCIGVSAGACHAASYLAKQHGRAFAVSTDYLKDKNYCSVYSLLTTGNLFGVEMLYDIIPNQLYPIDNETFLNNTTKFQTVITNCLTGEAEYPTITDLVKDVGYIRASSSLPMMAKMVSLNEQFYLDGGVADSIPIRQSIKEGNNKNVVILTQHRAYRKQANKMIPLLKMKYHKYPQLLEKMINRHTYYNTTLDFLFEEEKKGNVLIIAPSEPLEIGRIEKDKNKLQKVYKQGYEEAQKKHEKIIEFIRDI